MFGDREGGDTTVDVGFNQKTGAIKIIGGQVAGEEDLLRLGVG